MDINTITAPTGLPNIGTGEISKILRQNSLGVIWNRSLDDFTYPMIAAQPVADYESRNINVKIYKSKVFGSKNKYSA